MAQSKKTSKKKSSSNSSKFQSWLRPSTPLRGMVMFAIVFAVIGGTFFAFKSFAATTGTISATSVSGKDAYGCPRDYTKRPTLRLGSSGACVKTAQSDINKFTGDGSGSVAIDGQYGFYTERMVRGLQASSSFNGGPVLTADGIVGQATWSYFVRVETGTTR